MKDKILDIFYNSIVPEAANGSVDCFMFYNICFSTEINGEINFASCPSIDPPLLKISDKIEFDDLLVEYVERALDFYDEVLSGEYATKENKLCKEKVLMTLIWSNASIEDFQYPCQFLRRQAAFLKNSPISLKDKLGYSCNLKGEIFTEVKKTKKLSWESPYAFVSSIERDEDKHDLPVIQFGMDEDTVYIYSIHMMKNARRSKVVNRALYKVNENFTPSVNEGDLKDITPSSLVALTLFLLHCEKLGYSNYKIVPYLPQRWIDKMLYLKKKMNRENNDSLEYDKELDKNYVIQDNLTQKFIRTLLRLEYHFKDNLQVISYPLEQDSYLSFRSAITNSYSNNPLFSELSSMYHDKLSMTSFR